MRCHNERCLRWEVENVYSLIIKCSFFCGSSASDNDSHDSQQALVCSMSWRKSGEKKSRPRILHVGFRDLLTYLPTSDP